MSTEKKDASNQEQERANPIAVISETDGGVMTRWTEAAEVVCTNIDAQEPEGRAALTRCMATADLKTRSAVGQVLEAVSFFAHVVEIADIETGEISKKIRCVLVLKDGRTWSTTSKACVRTIAILHKATGGKEWNPPLLLEVREFPLEGGRTYCDLRELPRKKEAKK